MNNENLIIRPETHKDYKDIVSLVLRSFQEGTDVYVEFWLPVRKK